MKIKKIHLLNLSILICFYFSACNKPASTPGPAGADGKTGAQGIAGATGAKGDKGDPGSANVFYSDWIKNKQTPFTVFEKRITAEIIDKGVVLLYYRSQAFSVKIFVDNIYYSINIYLGQISIFAASTLTYIPEFRYIIIPPGTNVNAGRKAALQAMSYEEVKALYNIMD